MSIQTDVVVIGAGPVALFQAFQLGLLGLRCELVDAQPHAGGQCVALYPDKPIYDVPGVPRCTGRELTELLLQQAAPFLPTDPDTGQRPNVHLGHLVTQLQRLDSPAPGAPRFAVHTDQGLSLRARAVVVAAGAGAFLPRALPLPGLPSPSPLNLHHHLPPAGDAPAWAGADLIVAGGGDEALQTLLDLLDSPPAHRPSRLRLLHRRDQFQAEAALELAVREHLAAGHIELLIGVPQGCTVEPGGRLTHIHLLGADAQPQVHRLDHLLVRLGLSPKLGPLSDWGLALDRKQVAVDPATFESNLPGVYAVGDINTYAGKKRLLLCGFHEATLAAHGLASDLRPHDPQHLLYTTTSPLLHQRLGLV